MGKSDEQKRNRSADHRAAAERRTEASIKMRHHLANGKTSSFGGEHSRKTVAGEDMVIRSPDVPKQIYLDTSPQKGGSEPQDL
jgi:hypothetical protein